MVVVVVVVLLLLLILLVVVVSLIIFLAPAWLIRRTHAGNEWLSGERGYSHTPVYKGKVLSLGCKECSDPQHRDSPKSSTHPLEQRSHITINAPVNTTVF